MKTSVRKDKKSDDKQSVFTAETLGVVLVLFSALSIVCLFTADGIFSVPGLYLSRFLRGMFGFFAYPVAIFCAVLGVMLVIGVKVPGTLKAKSLVSVFIALAVILVHAITMYGKTSLSYGEYLSASYSAAEEGAFACSGGGLVAGLITYFIAAILKDVGTYVVVGVLIAATCYAFFKDIRKDKRDEESEKTPAGSFVNETAAKSAETDTATSTATGAYSAPNENKNGARLFVSDASAFEIKGKKDYKESDDRIKITYATSGLGVANASYSAAYGEDMQSKLNYVMTPAKIPTGVSGKDEKKQSPYAEENGGTVVSRPIPAREDAEDDVIPLYEHDGDEAKKESVDTVDTSSSAEKRAETFGERYSEEDFEDAPAVNRPDTEFFPVEEIKENKIEDADAIEDESEDEQNDFGLSSSDADRGGRRVREFFGSAETEPSFKSRVAADDNGAAAVIPEPEIEKPQKEIPPINREYFRPPFDLLESYALPVDRPKENHDDRMETIIRVLAANGIAADPNGYIEGPTVTRYELTVSEGIDLRKLVNCSDQLMMKLRALNGVRVLAPIPGKDSIGIEVANENKKTVGLRSVLEGIKLKDDSKSSMYFMLGKNLVGESVYDNIINGPHFLIAGGTQSGKSVCLNVMITSLIMRYSPEDLRFILIDPKKVEFAKYEHMPHLLVDEVITDAQKGIAVLSWAYEEMERRYAKIAQYGVSDVGAFNDEIADETIARIPRILIVIDELADFMMTNRKDVEPRLIALSQKARAAGIHLILATQRPSVDIIPNTIKINLGGRVALKVPSHNDSQVIIDAPGAEKLLGFGDMLYKSLGVSNMERYQGAFISAREVKNVVSFIKEHNKAYFDDDLKEYLENAVRPKQEEERVMADASDEPSDSNSELFVRALAYAVSSGKISISLIQRRFQIGYIRAAGLIDKMEQNGYVAPPEGSKARPTYMTKDQFEEKYGPLSDAL